MSTVVVTGANRGLGLELARVYAGRGDRVIAGCRNPAATSELGHLTEHLHALDMGDEQSIVAFVEAVGDQPVDIVVNNAGIDARNLGASDSERDVLTQTPRQLMGQIEVNAVGPWLLSRSLLPQLRRSSRPRIVNITSQIGSMEVSQRIGRDVGYAASKAALNMITVKLAVRLRDEGIIAVMIHPGFLRTDMGGAAATMGPDESARHIADTVDGLTIDDTGSFRRWDGAVHPW
jgi:NAD(P)-dependent dehydrogenase (short-subunit alcohol dehydrogenase family)